MAGLGILTMTGLDGCELCNRAICKRLEALLAMRLFIKLALAEGSPSLGGVNATPVLHTKEALFSGEDVRKIRLFLCHY